MAKIGFAAMMLVVMAVAGSAAADDSKLAKEGVEPEDTSYVRGKNKLCCGYPLAEEQGFKYTYYWMADQDWHLDMFDAVDIYTREGWYIGSFTEDFVKGLNMEGSGWLSDGRVLNYNGRCRYGAGKCFETMDPDTHPFGRGAGRRPLVPWKSVAVDRRLIPIGDTLYAPEFDGMMLPDGSFHDGCWRADDTGGAIKRKLIDLFIAERDNFPWVNEQMWYDRYFTPHVEDPRCDYLLDE